MNPQELPKRGIILCMVVLALFLIGQLVSLLYDATDAYEWFRQWVMSS